MRLDQRRSKALWGRRRDYGIINSGQTEINRRREVYEYGTGLGYLISWFLHCWCLENNRAEKEEGKELMGRGLPRKKVLMDANVSASFVL